MASDPKIHRRTRETHPLTRYKPSLACNHNRLQSHTLLIYHHPPTLNYSTPSHYIISPIPPATRNYLNNRIYLNTPTQAQTALHDIFVLALVDDAVLSPGRCHLQHTLSS